MKQIAMILKDSNPQQDGVAGHVCDKGMAQSGIAPTIRGSRRSSQDEETQVAFD